jgi:hypothetical protein
LNEYRQRLYTWADQYRHQRWPPTTPEYLLRGYYNMLTATGDLPRMITSSTDPARQDRMLERTGGDAAALAEITTAQNTLLTHDQPDLTAMVRLAIHRDHLADRNSAIPTNLPAIWVTLGQPNRAEAVAHSITDPYYQSQALGEVAGALVGAGEFGQAQALARTITDPYYQSQALGEVAGALVEAGEFGQAQTLARTITDPDHQIEALHSLTMAPDSNQARRATARILTLDRWEKSLNSLARIKSNALMAIDSELAIVAKRSAAPGRT